MPLSAKASRLRSPFRAESYTWSTGATGSSITVQPVTTTTYTVTPRTGTCVGDPVSHTVTVNPKPVITFDGDFEICAGEKAVITADGADTYTWGDGTTGATYTTAALNANTTFTVTGRITATGCEAQAQVTVIVNPKPTISISGDKEVCAGSSATLTVWPNGGTYVWSNGSKERTATFNNLISDQDYWVDVTLPNGCTDRYNGTIKVNPIPPGYNHDKYGRNHRLQWRPDNTHRFGRRNRHIHLLVGARR